MRREAEFEADNIAVHAYADAAKREPEVTAEVRSLEKSVAVLSETIDALQERLVLVTRQSEPREDVNAMVEPAPECQLGGDLRRIGRYIRDRADVLRDLIERIEV